MKLLTIIGWIILLSVTFVYGKDYYSILELSKDADDKQIKLSYRQLSKKYHPDKNSSPEAHEKFIEIGEAYEVLSDPDKRAKYDQYGDPNGPQQDDMDLGDIFNQFFGGFGGGFGGGGARQRGKRRGDNTKANMHLSLYDFYNGKDVDFDVDMLNICSACEGTGSEDKSKHQCDRCNGSGFLKMQRQLAPGMIQTFNTHCDKCNGKGTTIKHHCKECGGQGTERVSRHYNVYVPSGAPRDSHQVLEGEGDQNPDWIPGDLILTFREEFASSWGYRRIGNNLYRTEVLTLKEAAHGGWKRHIPFFDSIDHEITIQRTKGDVVLNGEVEIIPHKGMPIAGEDDHFGDLFIDYKVIIPGPSAHSKDEL